MRQNSQLRRRPRRRHKTNTQYGTTGSGFVSGNYNGIGPNDAGSSLANFLLGYRAGFITRGDPGGPYFQSNKEIAFFVQDDWKATPTLTLNLGLRYDMFTAPTERFDAQYNFDPASRRIMRRRRRARAGARPRQHRQEQLRAARRLRVERAASDDRRMVVRGGYGVVYTPDVSGQLPLDLQPPASGAYNCGFRASTGTCDCSRASSSATSSTWACRCRRTSTTPWTRSPADRRSASLYIDPNDKTPSIHQYNLTCQYEFMPNWLADAAYVGSAGSNLLPFRTSEAVDQLRPRLARGGGDQQGRRHALQRQSRFDAFQTKVERRFTRGFSMLSSYTWSHGIDDTPGGFCRRTARARATAGRRTRSGRNSSAATPTRDVRHGFTFANVL